jgi:tRNA (Thr-GGU) A37 N-methylase
MMVSVAAVPPESFELSQIGVVESSLGDLAAAPKQGGEGSQEAWIMLEPKFLEGLVAAPRRSQRPAGPPAR